VRKREVRAVVAQSIADAIIRIVLTHFITNPTGSSQSAAKAKSLNRKNEKKKNPT